MIVIDTSVLSYSVGSEHQFREPCIRLMDAVEAGTIRATTTPEVLQEFAWVRARRRSLIAAATIAGATAVASADEAFARVAGIRHVVPDEAGVALLLGH